MILESTRTSRGALLLAVCLLAAMALAAEAQKAGKLTQNPCGAKDKCHTCIQTESCAWCMQPDFKGQSRCFQHTSNVCPEEFVWNPDTSEQILLNKNLTLASTAGIGMGAGGAGYGAGGAGYGAGGAGYGAGGAGYISGGSSSSYHSSSSSSMSSSFGSEYSAGWSSSEIVQIKPQSVKLKLRISKYILAILIPHRNSH